MMNKATQRKICLERRNSLTDIQIKEYSVLICDKLIPYIENKNVLAYMAYDSEVDLSSIYNNKFSYPVINGDTMDGYMPINNKFIVNKFNIKEPDPNYSKKINKQDLDVVIVPCVGFDEKLNRLGHGKGYYDKYLKDLNVLKIAVGFEIQKLEDIIHETYDIKMDMIITEINTYK